MRSLLFATAACAAVSCVGGGAARAETPVDEIIVTATRLPTNPDVVTGARVVDRTEIEARNIPFAQDLLSTIPGVGVARAGAFGGVAAIRIRGASPDKTLVLIDGVPSGDAADPSGAYDASTIQTQDLERIEVLSGPQGSLWGSEAIGGVVSFTTRELDGVELAGEGGAFNSLRGFVGAGTRTDAYAVSASVAGFRTDGISKAASGTEDDGFKSLSANLNGRVKLASGVKLDGRLRYSRADVDLDGFAAPRFILGDTNGRSRSRTWQGFARAGGEAFGLTHEVSLSAYDLKRRNISTSTASFDADRQVLRWTAAKGDRFVAGVERQETSAHLSSGKSLDLSNTSVFGVGKANVGPLTLTASARHDDPERYASRTTGRLAVAAGLGGGFTAVVSAGTGFKTPTISQAVCDFCFRAPVPLKPERAEGYDLKLGWANDRVSASLTGYRLLVRDQISYVASRYINIARTSSSGVEADFDARLSDSLRLKLGYAWLDAIDRSTTRSLLRVPDHSGSAALFWNEGPWSGAVTVRAESSQSDTATDGFSRAVRKGFVTADVSGAYAVTPRLSLTARIENVADRRYQEILGYGEPGAAVYVGLRFRD